MFSCWLLRLLFLLPIVYSKYIKEISRKIIYWNKQIMLMGKNSQYILRFNHMALDKINQILHHPGLQRVYDLKW